VPQLTDIACLVLHHHERMDGSGYPHGLSGDEIPLGSRILCVADSFDAMVTSRIYRPTVSVPKALAELERCSGTQFDIEVVRVFGAYLRNEGLSPSRRSSVARLKICDRPRGVRLLTAFSKQGGQIIRET
jgi:HD-GYP domain-containing protein (c-di-GMP phosphodiesterase class II)